MKNWIAVASAEHVNIGQTQGFMQVCHGKVAPLRRIQAGDKVVYYSPTYSFGCKDKLQAFTAIGIAKNNPPYQVEMAEGFCPFRRDVDWFISQPAPIFPLLEKLEFTRGKRNWGFSLRFGLLAIREQDMATIATAMSAIQQKNKK